LESSECYLISNLNNLIVTDSITLNSDLFSSTDLGYLGVNIKSLQAGQLSYNSNFGAI
jgi:hypothetical protein